ncbi:Endolytic murein transglycosylase [Natranaerofaba carboxydovora]|nr:endolytic transglycosylase MltG [Natranaerofaba carboxydovora]UMZ74004.1 Endolytic murein transglycosylase [Natranaerofaba carboxydovora]
MLYAKSRYIIIINRTCFKNWRGGFFKIVSIIKKYKIIITVILLLGVLAIFSSFYFVYSNLQPVGSSEIVEIEISQGSSVGDIANILEDNNLIKNAFVFEMYTRYEGLAGSFQAGTYELNGEMSPSQIANKIKDGEVVDKSIRFTIPEGLRSDQTAKLLQTYGFGDKETFLELFNSLDEFDYWFLDEIDQRENVKFSLEGFLYPETYNIEEDATEKEVVKKLLDQFNSVFNSEFRERKEELDMDIMEIMTIASIVEREAISDRERSKVAGVFYNRLEENKKLEACSTVEYVLQENKPRLTIEDTEIESRYNTYKHEGLPPGPIASPGIKSIEAALFPEDHDYFFFVAKEDGSREHYFSETLDEHIRARQRARSND